MTVWQVIRIASDMIAQIGSHLLSGSGDVTRLDDASGVRLSKLILEWSATG